MSDSIEYCQDCETNVACHLNRGCLRLGGLSPSGAVPCSASSELPLQPYQRVLLDGQKYSAIQGARRAVSRQCCKCGKLVDHDEEPDICRECICKWFSDSGADKCHTNLNARWCATENRWRIPGDRCLACSGSRQNDNNPATGSK